MKRITTLIQKDAAVTEETAAAWEKDRDSLEQQVLNIYPQVTYQKFEGFGGAVTEAGAHVLTRMPSAVRSRILDRYFGPDGLRYSWCRISIDSCDFSTGHYCADSIPEDEDLKEFSLSRDEQEIIPILKEAMTRNPELKLMLSPWSPPAYMKTNGCRNHGGKLLPQYYGRWARYLCRYILEYRKHGFQIGALSVQNEANATQTWDSCTYTAGEESAFISDFLGPALCEAGLQDIDLFIWDHNKERLFERLEESCRNSRADTYINGAAFHWYTGDHFEALELAGRRFPGKKLFFTEGCVEYSRFTGEQKANAFMYAHDILGNLNGGAHASLDWNIVLDHLGGPNHVKNYCAAPVMCNIENGQAQEQLSMNYIEHFSRYILPGAVRIGFTRYTSRLEMTAFRNPDASFVCIIFNPGREPLRAVLRCQGNALPLPLPPESLTTLLWEA